MSLSDFMALTFDPGGKMLDWHAGFRETFFEGIGPVRVEGTSSARII